MDPIVIVNGSDRAWARHRYILAFGAYGWTRLMVWANGIDSALDEAVDWIAKNAPGLLCDDTVQYAYKFAIGEGISEERAQELAEQDTTCAGNAGHYIASHEWFILAEDPTRAQVLEIQGRA